MSKDKRRSRHCRPDFDRGPARAEAVVRREQRQYPGKVRFVQGGGFDGPYVPLTIGDLEDAFRAAKAPVLPDAAFLAGRSTTGVTEDTDWFRAEVRAVKDLRPPDDLRALAASYVEAAMSLALLGEVDVAQAALAPLVADGGHSTRAYLAAAYLAQLGDPSGWPVMVAALNADSEHTRLMAARNLLSFVAYDGRAVGTTTVDVGTGLANRLDDSSVYVSREVPGLLVEAGVPDVKSILESVIDSGRPEEVRQAATAALGSV